MNLHASLQYLLSVNLILLVTVLFYRLFLARLPRFHWNRIYLLVSSVLAFILPLIQVALPNVSLSDVALVRRLPEVLIGPQGAVAVENQTALPWMVWVYLGVAGILLLVLASRMGQLVYSLMSSPRVRKDDLTLVLNQRFKGPASFFNFLFWDPALDQQPERAAFVLAHEKCHIRQGHSYDLIWLELLSILCWFNPAIYLLKTDLRQTHEFLADQAAMQTQGQKALHQSILSELFGSAEFPLVNHFQSQIKARIMMSKRSSNPRHLLRYLLVIPLGLILFACSSIENAPETENPALSKEKATLSDAPGMNEVVELDQQPTPLNMSDVRVAIGYPEVAQLASIEGKVIARVLVGKDGSVEEAAIVNTPDPVLVKAVEAHIGDLKFTPGQKDGKTVKTWVTIPFKFKLNP